MDFKTGLNGTIDFLGDKFYCRFNDWLKNNTPTVETTARGVCKLIDEVNLMPGKKSFVGIFDDTEHNQGVNVVWFGEPVCWKLKDDDLYIVVKNEKDEDVRLFKFGGELRSLLFGVEWKDEKPNA